MLCILLTLLLCLFYHTRTEKIDAVFFHLLSFLVNDDVAEILAGTG